MLGDSNIRYIYDTQHLNIICIISYFDIFPFLHYFHSNIYAITLISLHRTAGPSPCIFFVTFNTFFVLMIDKPRLSLLSFDHIAYSAKNTGERCVFVIYIHKGMFNSLIFILLLFCLSHIKIFRTKQGDCFLWSYT